MTQKYLNTGFNTGTSSFTDLTSPLSTEAVFTARSVKASVGGSTVPMVRGTLALRSASAITTCEASCPLEIIESVKVEFNVERGAANLNALRAEVDRLFDKAAADYGFTAGHVPPPQATFSE